MNSVILYIITFIILSIILSIIIAIILKYKQNIYQDKNENKNQVPIPLQAVLGEKQIINEGETSIPKKTIITDNLEPISAPTPNKIGTLINNNEPQELL